MTEQNTTQTTIQKDALSLPREHSPNRKNRHRSAPYSNKNLQSQKPVFQRRKKIEFDPNKFFWLYGVGDLKQQYEILDTSEKRLSFKGTTIEQVRGELRERIRSLGGNGVIGLKVERGNNSQNLFGTGYVAAEFSASGWAVLVAPKELDDSRKVELRENFKKKGNTPTAKSKDVGMACNLFLFALTMCFLYYLVR